MNKKLPGATGRKKKKIINRKKTETHFLEQKANRSEKKFSFHTYFGGRGIFTDDDDDEDDSVFVFMMRSGLSVYSETGALSLQLRPFRLSALLRNWSANENLGTWVGSRKHESFSKIKDMKLDARWKEVIFLLL